MSEQHTEYRHPSADNKWTEVAGDPQRDPVRPNEFGWKYADTRIAFFDEDGNLDLEQGSLEEGGVALQALPGAMRLAADASASATSATVRTEPESGMSGNLFAVFLKPSNLNETEIRRVTVSGATLSWSTGLTYSHSAGDPVVWSHSPRANVLWFGATPDGTDVTTAIERADAQGPIYVPSGTYGISDLDLSNPPAFEEDVLFQIQAGASYGVKITGDGWDYGAMAGALEIDMQNVSNCNGLVIASREAHIPKVIIEGDSAYQRNSNPTPSGNVGILYQDDGSMPVTHNYVLQAFIRRVDVGILLDPTASQYAANNFWGHIYIQNTQDGIKYRNRTGGLGVFTGIWQRVFIEGFNRAIHFLADTPTQATPHSEQILALHLDTKGEDVDWFYLDGTSPNNYHVFMSRGENQDIHDRNDDGSKRIVTLNGASDSGIHQLRANDIHDDAYHANLRIQADDHKDGIKFSVADTTSVPRDKVGWGYVKPLDLTDGTYQWTSSGSGTNEYYLEASGGGDPSVAEPDYVVLDNTVADKGTLGSLSAGEWGYGDNDALGFSTVYVRLSDGTDPDSKSAGYVLLPVDWSDTPTAGFGMRINADRTVSHAWIGPEQNDYWLRAEEPTVNDTTSVYLVIRKAGSNVLRQVEIGAADSAGSGYRALRVAN